MIGWESLSTAEAQAIRNSEEQTRTMHLRLQKGQQQGEG